jgi:tetratricopeptide (TPR) repeat protein
VFAGGFDLNAIEAICGDDPLAPEDALDIVTSLVEKSLLRAEDSEDGARYRMLETIRDYAREKLVLRDEQMALAEAHAKYFLEMARAGMHGMESPEAAEWMRRLEGAHDDMRGAIGYGMTSPEHDPILAVRFVAALMGFWLLHGYVTEGRRYVQNALELPGVRDNPFGRGHALYVGAALADSQGFHAAAEQMLDECLAVRRTLDAPVDIAATLSTRSLVMLHTGRAAEARKDESEAVEIFRNLKHQSGEAMALLHLGQIEAHVGNYADARRLVEQAVSIAREIGYAEVEGEGELTLGQIELNCGDVAGAASKFEHSQEVCRDAEDKRGQASATWWLGKIDLRERHLERARVRLTAALRAFQSFEMNAELAGCLEDFGELLVDAGSAGEGAKLFGVTSSLRERLSLSRTAAEEERFKRTVAGARELAGVEQFDSAFATGRSLGTSEAVQLALSSTIAETTPA